MIWLFEPQLITDNVCALLLVSIMFWVSDEEYVIDDQVLGSLKTV